MALEDVADGLVAHLVPEVSQSPGDSIVTPTSILRCEADDEILDLLVDCRATRVIPFLRAVEPLRHELRRKHPISPDDLGKTGS